mmetsp:Transcript_41036/g.96401  ORF Transcript_41036/g.96401 Transcript_41036/m.96401 type:complete len:133 (-) Transcript_41036:1498-1896(-)
MRNHAHQGSPQGISDVVVDVVVVVEAAAIPGDKPVVVEAVSIPGFNPLVPVVSTMSCEPAGRLVRAPLSTCVSGNAAIHPWMDTSFGFTAAGREVLVAAVVCAPEGRAEVADATEEVLAALVLLKREEEALV